MQEIAENLKVLNLYTHLAHNLAKGPSFFADHEFLGDVYEKADDHYDSVVERMIGLDEAPDIQKIIETASSKFSSLPNTPKNESFFAVTLQIIEKLKDQIEQYCEQGECSEGTEQLLGGIADELEVWTYKIKQRIG